MTVALKVGLAGLGTVGVAVARMLDDQRDALAQRCGRPIEIVAVSARTRAKKRDFGVHGARWFDDPVAMAKDDGIDVFVELMGGDGDPALACVTAALASGKAVVTANKALLARHGLVLGALAERHQVALNFEAAIGGAIPIVKSLREALLGNTFSRVYGILNGTCNYILSRMESDRMSFADCLAEAQRLGYAEADPTFDIEGHDTAQKLSLLSSLAFGTEVDPAAVYVEGISSITLADIDAADELGYRIKLLGVAMRTGTGIEQRVHPTMVPKDSEIAQVMGVTNAVSLDIDGINPITLVGPGAGGAATASAVVSDIVDVARGIRTPPFGRPTAKLSECVKAPMQRHEGGYYIRLLARDRSGTAATIATRLSERGISLESIVQRHRGPRPQGGDDPKDTAPVPVILVTYATSEDAVRKALAAVEADGVIAETPQLIRIEKNR